MKIPIGCLLEEFFFKSRDHSQSEIITKAKEKSSVFHSVWSNDVDVFHHYCMARLLKRTNITIESTFSRQNGVLNSGKKYQLVARSHFLTCQLTIVQQINMLHFKVFPSMHV